MTYTIDDIKAALAKVKIDGDLQQATELVDMLASCGDQRGDMMMEFTRQSFLDFQRKLLKEFGVSMPCDCGVQECVGDPLTCGHYGAVKQLEFEVALGDGHE